MPALPPQARCTRSAGRLLTSRWRDEHTALETAWARETEAEFAAHYPWRAGIKGIVSAGARVLHLRRSRYRGLAKTHLQRVLTATAMNLVRSGA